MRGVLLALALVACGGSGESARDQLPQGGQSGAPNAGATALAGADGSTVGLAGYSTGGTSVDGGAGGESPGGDSAGGSPVGPCGPQGCGAAGKSMGGAPHGGASGAASGGMLAGGSGGASGETPQVLWETTQTISALVQNDALVRASLVLTGEIPAGGTCYAAVPTAWRPLSATVGTQTVALDETDVPCFTKLGCDKRVIITWAGCEDPPTCSSETSPGFWDGISPNCDGVGPDLSKFKLESMRVTVSSVTFDPYDNASKIAHIAQHWELLGRAL